MTPVPTEAIVAAWKRQVDFVLQLAETCVQGVQTAWEIQRDAAIEAQASLKAARSTVAAAAPADLVALEMRLANENIAKIAQYWGALAANARDTQGRILKIVMSASAAMPLLSPSATVDPQAAGTLNELVDAGYRQWLEALGQLYPTSSAARAA
jgi:hypothetical protein